MIGKHLFVSIVVAAVVTAAASVAVAGSSDNADWEVAIAVRSQGLNERYGLTETRPRELGDAGPGWMKALRARSSALNRKHELGRFAPPARTATPAWRDALLARSKALNRAFRLGQSAP